MQYIMYIYKYTIKNICNCVSPCPGGIADPAVFARQPEVYAYGMVIALAVGFLWQAWASWAGFNVSATHSISKSGVPAGSGACLL